jgi:hypothetical protein
MTIFKYSKNGELYTIQVNDNNGVKTYTAIPINHSGGVIKNCNTEEFSIHILKNGGKNTGFI